MISLVFNFGSPSYIYILINLLPDNVSFGLSVIKTRKEDSLHIGHF